MIKYVKNSPEPGYTVIGKLLGFIGNSWMAGIGQNLQECFRSDNPVK